MSDFVKREPKGTERIINGGDVLLRYDDGYVGKVVR